MTQATGTAPKRKTIQSAEGFSLKQGTHELFVVKLRAGDLTSGDVTDIESLDKDNPEGYQRELKDKRAKAIAEFVRAGNAIPPAVILSARIKPVLIRKGVYEFQLPLFVIDGQHRKAGFFKAIEADPSFADFEVACVIVYVNNSIEKETKLFVDINRSQRPVSNDLTVVAQYNLSKTATGKKILEQDAILNERQDVQTRAYKVALRLNDDGGMLPVPNPLKGRIKLYVEDKPTVRNPISQQSVVRSLERVVTEDATDLDLRQSTTALLAYWRGVALTWPKQVELVNDHMILRNIGVEVLHRVYPTVLAKIEELGGDATNPIHYHKVLMLATKDGGKSGLTDNFWRQEGRIGKVGGGASAFSILADEIVDHIKANFWLLKRKGF